MQDDAVSPVLAAMLLFAVIVTLISVFQGVVVPQMKAQAEVEHLGDVETSFLQFSSHLDNAVATGGTMRMSERIPLGGGDVLFSSQKSAGIARIETGESPLVTVTVSNAALNQKEYAIYPVNISYRPLSNFWLDQGYTWAYGYINVTKGDRSTPLEYADVAAVVEDSAHRSSFPATLVQSDYKDGAVTVRLVDISASGRDSASGNGYAKITLDSSVSVPSEPVNPDKISIRVFKNQPLSVDAGIWERVTQDFQHIQDAFPSVIYTTDTANPDFNEATLLIPGGTIDFRLVNIELSLY